MSGAQLKEIKTRPLCLRTAHCSLLTAHLFDPQGAVGDGEGEGGSAVILAGGWLGLLRFYPATQAFALGVAPFLAGDVVKIALAAAVLPSGWALVRRK